jgi:hypothetical protein
MHCTGTVGPDGAQKDQNPLALTAAWFGSTDVTSKTLAQFQIGGHLLIEPTASFVGVFGDVCPGHRKTLRLCFANGDYHELQETRVLPFYKSWTPPPALEQLDLVYVLFFSFYSLQKAYERFGAHAWCVPTYVPTSSMFENYAICQAPVLSTQHNWAARRCIGFVSWRAPEKYGEIISKIEAVVNHHDWSICDAVPLYSCLSQAGRFGDPFFVYHPNFASVWERHVTPKLGAASFASWRCNYWMATPAAVLEYANFLRKDLLPALCSDEDCFKDSTYGRPITPEMEQVGWRFYPLLPFLLERVVGKYFQWRAAQGA